MGIVVLILLPPPPLRRRCRRTGAGPAPVASLWRCCTARKKIKTLKSGTDPTSLFFARLALALRRPDAVLLLHGRDTPRAVSPEERVCRATEPLSWGGSEAAAAGAPGQPSS